jgi:hypothetical protein
MRSALPFKLAALSSLLCLPITLILILAIILSGKDLYTFLITFNTILFINNLSFIASRG